MKKQRRPAGEDKKKSKKPARSRAAAGKAAAEARRKSKSQPPLPEPPRPAGFREAAEVLLNLESLLKERIHGKDDAIEKIGSALRVRLTRLDFRPERPNGSFLLIGPPGVGKNEFAYAVANILYGDESMVVPIDMRMVTTEEEASRLTDSMYPGPPPLLLEGMITTPIRRRPHSILLLRGIEHAHPVAHRMIQQILDQGWIEDARGRVAFDQTIVFATSRIPEEEAGTADEIGFNRTSKSYDERIRERMIRKLGEEFVESFQEVIVIHPLTPEHVRQIARYKVEVVLRRLQRGRRGVQVTDSVFKTFIPDDECARSGAGTINRTLEKRLLNPLARYILAHPKERQIRVDIRDGDLVIERTIASTPSSRPATEAESRA